MPGIAQAINSNTGCVKDDAANQNSLAGNVKLPFWSQHPEDVSQNLLEEFWCELSLQARKKLLRIDKQTLFEHSRKNMYCSRCNGLLLEGFSQIVIYAKSLQHDADGSPYCAKATYYQNNADLCTTNGCQDNVWDPSLHPWGGLTTTRDGKLTLLDCYLYSKSLKGLQNVFDYARARERERELLYPDACGGGGRGWITQGVAGYGRGHGTRDTCALHTARLSVETLVDFWSALGVETRQSLLRMKEDDFIERLIHRFESKRFCRDCRRNVIREFKELKELKRMRRQTRCTSWFCVADTTFQCQVSRDTVQADWHQTFSDAFGKYHHFEWAIGSGEGKSDILEFENVGLSGKVQANGLDLSGLNACYITLRAWRMDGRCNELCVKAHALRGHLCVHCRLVVGDGFLTITRGESMTRFFEHAEEAEEEEDDDSVDKDGNDLDGECTRPQKHAKSPELAREFLLDAATVIFKEQVEKAFREGTARQNSHSIFVCLALKLLEERVHVACKDIITLEKQTKLLEEEEKEKREEEERKERRRTKEREKKLRKKERLREKEIKEKKCVEIDLNPVVTDVVKEVPIPSDGQGVENVPDGDSGNERGEVEATPSSPLSPDILIQHTYSHVENNSKDILDGEFGNTRDWNTPPNDHIKYPHRKPSFRKDSHQDLNLKWSDRRKGQIVSENGYEFTRSVDAFNKQLRTNVARYNLNRCGGKLSEKIQCTSGNLIGDRYDSHSCTCNHHHAEYRSRSEPQITRVTSPDISKPYHRGKKYNNTRVECGREINGRPKSKIVSGNTPKKVWEPLDSQKKCIRSNSDSDFTLRSSTLKVEPSESGKLPECCSTSSDEATDISVQANQEDKNMRDLAGSTTKTHKSSMSNSSNSDNFSSCLSDGDINLYSKSTSTSDSEEVSQISDGKETSDHSKNTVCMSEEQAVSAETNSHKEAIASPCCEKGRESISIDSQPHIVLPQMHSDRNINYPIFQASTMGYYHPNPVSWTFPYSSHYSIPSSFKYGLNGNAQFVQYRAFQPLTPPIINHTPAPVFHPVSQVNGVITNATGLKEVDRSIPKVPPMDVHGQNQNADKTDVGDNGFSLFHFGGPVALSTGFKDDHSSLNEGIMEDMKKSSANCPDGDHPCGKKDSVEEYNLFAATNGIKFSIF